MEADAILREKTAIVGVGATPYYPRGTSEPQTPVELSCKSVLAAAADAGVPLNKLDGFTFYSYLAAGFDINLIYEALGLPEVRFTAAITGGGGGSVGAVGLAA